MVEESSTYHTFAIFETEEERWVMSPPPSPSFPSMALGETEVQGRGSQQSWWGECQGRGYHDALWMFRSVLSFTCWSLRWKQARFVVPYTNDTSSARASPQCVCSEHTWKSSLGLFTSTTLKLRLKRRQDKPWQEQPLFSLTF